MFTKRAAIAVAAAAFMSSLPAQAYTVTSSAGPTSSTSGAITFDNFDDISNTAIATVSGGTSNGGSSPGYGNWLAADSNDTITVTFTTSPASYFGFLWGTPDTYNSVTPYQGATPLTKYIIPASLNQSQFFANFSAGSGEYFTSVVLASTGYSFEVDNFAAILSATPGATPLPGALPLFATGIASAGLLGWRRRRKAAVAA